MLSALISDIRRPLASAPGRASAADRTRAAAGEDPRAINTTGSLLYERMIKINYSGNQQTTNGPTVPPDGFMDKLTRAVTGAVLMAKPEG